MPTSLVAGLLTQSLHPSPTIRWILPARIRRRDQNDVVFVGENYIQLREFLPNGQLTDVTAKIDLGIQILAANVISSQTELSFVDQVVKQELEDDYCIVDKNGETHLYPPQILVISTASCDVLYLFAKKIALGKVEFIHAKRSISADIRAPERYPKHLAVDHESRAMAIGSSMHDFVLFPLKSVHDIANEIELANSARPDQFKPMKEERYTRVDGLILKMDFLPPPSDKMNHIILVLLVAREQSTSIQLFCYDERLGVRDLDPAPFSSQKSPLEDRYPLMLIPSTRSTSFILVTETDIVVYDYNAGMSSQAHRLSIPLENRHPRQYENSTIGPLFTQWTKPKRHEVYNQTHDDICLAREDGILRHYVIDRTTPTRIDAHYRPGDLGINIDTAFTSMEGTMRLGGGDYFIVGGDMTDGGVFHCRARQEPICKQIFPNFAPVLDMLTVNCHDHAGSKALSGRERRERIFLCSGRGTHHTAITEIRYGLEGQIALTADYHDLASVSDIWTIPDVAHERMFLLIAHAQHTTAMLLEPSTLELELANDELFDGLDLHKTTLGAAVVLDRYTAQVTSAGIHLAPLFSKVPMLSEPYSPPTSLAILAADVSKEDGLIALAFKTDEGFAVQAFKVSLDGSDVRIKDLGSPVSIQHDPSCVQLGRVASLAYVFAGMSDGSVAVMTVESKGGLSGLSEIFLADPTIASDASAIASICCLSHPGRSSCVLVCGSRSGHLICANLDVSYDGIAVKGEVYTKKSFILGLTTVHVTQDSADDTAALVSCGKDLRHVALLAGYESPHYSVRQIYLTSREEPTYQQPTINAIARIEGLPYLEEFCLGGSLIAITNDQLLISSLTLQSQPVARRLKVLGNPQRLAFSRHLNKLVVAVDHVKFDGGGTTAGSLMKRELKPAVQFVDADADEACAALSYEAAPFFIGETNEWVTSLINWTPSDGKKHYDMIIVATEVDDKETGECHGRLLCITTKQFTSSTSPMVKAKTFRRYPNKTVRAVQPFDMSSLLVAVGDEIVLLHLDVETRSWTQPCKLDLPSAATSIITKGSLIYIVTALHSFYVLKYENNEIRIHGNDVQARNGTNVAVCQDNSAIISTTSFQGAELLGFRPPTPAGECHVSLQAKLPLNISSIKSRHDAASAVPGAPNSFYASTLDGTLYGLTTLTQLEWQLLKILQDLVRQSQGEVSGKERRRRKLMSTKGLAAGPEMKHINGEKLALVLVTGADGVRDLVCDTALDPDFEPFSCIDDRIDEFCQKARDLLGESRDIFATAALWLRRLLG